MSDHFSPTSLYTTWLSALPQAFAAMVPASAASAAPKAANADDFTAPPMPFPVDQIAGAVKLIEGMLTQLYHGYLPLLAKGKLTAEPLQAMADGLADGLNKLLAAMPNPLMPDLPMPTPDATGLAAHFLKPWATLLPGLHMLGTPAQAVGTNDLQLGIERTFGGLGEAFGLGPTREFEAALREMSKSSVAKQRAQIEYLAVAAQAWKTGTSGLLKELQAMGERGERVESLLGFIRLWAKAIDAPMHEAMQGPKGLEVTAKVIRASSQHREQVQKIVGLASEALNVPTRGELDAAFREIQELKRELRRLKKALPPATQKTLLQAKESQA